MSECYQKNHQGAEDRNSQPHGLLTDHNMTKTGRRIMWNFPCSTYVRSMNIYWALGWNVVAWFWTVLTLTKLNLLERLPFSHQSRLFNKGQSVTVHYRVWHSNSETDHQLLPPPSSRHTKSCLYPRAIVWILMSSKGPCVNGLVLSLALLGDGGTFKMWDVVKHL
jgi:hypothetical protein